MLVNQRADNTKLRSTHLSANAPVLPVWGGSSHCGHSWEWGLCTGPRGFWFGKLLISPALCEVHSDMSLGPVGKTVGGNGVRMWTARSGEGVEAPSRSTTVLAASLLERMEISPGLNCIPLFSSIGQYIAAMQQKCPALSLQLYLKHKLGLWIKWIKWRRLLCESGLDLEKGWWGSTEAVIHKAEHSLPGVYGHISVAW